MSYRDRRFSLALSALVAGFALAAPAFALVRPAPEGTDARVIPAPFLDALPEEAPESVTGPAAAGAAAFRGRHPGDWRMTFDRRTGRPSLIEGQGIPFLQGRAKGLDEAAPLGLSFIDSEPDLLAAPGGELRLNRERSGWLDEGRVVFLDYDWYVDGVPVEGARVFLRASRGNIIQMGTARMGHAAPKATPVLGADEALDRLFEVAGGRAEGDSVVTSPALIYVARAAGKAQVPWGGGIVYRLAWRAAFRRAGEAATWTGDIDARTGEVLAFDDANRYARVTGGVFPRSPNETEEVRPITNVRVVSGGASVLTGDPGVFAYTSGPAYTSLDGSFFRVTCSGCSTPERAFAFADHGTGDLELGIGGFDAIGNGASTPAERNAFFHQNRVRKLALKWLSIGWLNQTVVTNVNIADVCNAFWDGSTTNFFQSGGGCSNTGTIADVMYHEWGHGLDQNTNLGDGSTGEATGDITSMHITHDARIGPYFETNGNPVRDLDRNRVGYVASVANLNAFCPVCQLNQCTNGPYGHEVHCEGEIYGQAHWELAQTLAAKYGYNTGWQELERIYFLSLAQADTMVATQAQNVYGAYLAVDDDNGNLADGTPNCLEIYNAFSAHGIAGTACAGNTVHCTRPAQPSMTVTPGHGRVILDWPVVPAASQYTVLRADFSATQVYMALATQAGTHFEDVTVQPGVTYWYVVEARTTGGCRSTIENAVAASPLPDSRPLLAATLVDDIPAGNRSGFADPGESIDVSLDLRNALPAGAAGAGVGVLTTATPNVSMTTNGAAWAPIAPGTSVTGGAFRAVLGAGLACGQTIDFSLSYDDGGGTLATAAVPVLVGERVPRYFENFDAGPAGWTTSAGTPAATQGQWVQGDPVGTSWQPEHDAGGAPGGQCLFTGQNSSDVTGDVDGGETIVTSPVIDLSGATAARLSYRRWWASSSLTDAGDLLVVEVSGNGGGSWVAAETVTAGARTLGWQPVDIRLESLVPLTSTFQVRVRARDTSTDTNVEAAIDDVRIEDVVCDPTPPCFVAPTFAGLATAVPGASCAETDLTWPAGGTNCQNAAIVYNVYRSTSAGFTPVPANRVATGLPGLAFHDTLLAPGATYHYIVRADDSRAGEESNSVERTVAASLAPDTVAPVYGGLAALQPGMTCGTTTLQWLPALETCSVPLRYNVYRSSVPGFLPDAATLVATVPGTTYLDTALVPGQTYYYKVHALDTAGNEEGNTVEAGAVARNLPFIMYHADFEASDGGWTSITPNDALTGRFEWADPEGTGAQPEDDATPPPGVKAWVTGPLAGTGLGDFDVDAGTTTIASPLIDISGRPSPQLILSAYFNNDFGANPGEDPFRIDVSANAGASWTPVLNTLTDIAPWTTLQFAITPTVPATSQFRVRVQTQDLGVGGSLVEAGIDEVMVLQPDAGCVVCSGPVAGVGAILVDRSGDDIVLDWSADPVSAPAYNVYLRFGAGLATVVRLGTTTTKSFIHAGGALFTGESFYYEVTAVDACGRESPAP